MVNRKYLVLTVLMATILIHPATSFAQSIWQSNPNYLPSNSNNLNTSQNLLNREINRQINPRNWRNSSQNWKYKTTKFTNKIGIFDSDGKRFEYHDSREDKIVVKPYSNGGNRFNNRSLFTFPGNYTHPNAKQESSGVSLF